MLYVRLASFQSPVKKKTPQRFLAATYSAGTVEHVYPVGKDEPGVAGLASSILGGGQDMPPGGAEDRGIDPAPVRRRVDERHPTRPRGPRQHPADNTYCQTKCPVLLPDRVPPGVTPAHDRSDRPGRVSAESDPGSPGRPGFAGPRSDPHRPGGCAVRDTSVPGGDPW